MPEYTAFLDRFRHDLGKGYSVAHQHMAANSAQIYLLVRKRGMAQTLSLVVEVHWLVLLSIREMRDDSRVEYKHLTVLVRRFFNAPFALEQPTFVWPGNQETRDSLRRALDPRLARRS